MGKSGFKDKFLELNHLCLWTSLGVTWVFEIISWADTKNRDSDAVPWYWILFDIINLLQAVAIFIIFVCKRRIINQLKNKYPQLKRESNDESVLPKIIN